MNRVRKYLLPRLLMPSNFCLPPVEYSPGTTPIQADSARPFPNVLALPTAAIRAVAVTGPTPGISVSRWQASFCLAVFWITRSISSIRAASCSSSSLSCASRTRNEPDRFNSASSQDARQLLIQMAAALGHGQPTFQKKPPNLVHYRRASHHPTLAHAMQSLQVQLLLRLDRHKTHSRSLHRFRNGFGIQVVTLVRLHVGLHVLRRHQPHFMTLFAQRPPQKVGSTAGLHANQLHLQIRGEGQQLGARTSLADDHPASGIQSHQMKARLT